MKGDYSNNPEVELSNSIARRYVGVRMQQGVPLLDLDWNLLEDIRRHEFETAGLWFIGDGVPVGNDGFRIVSTGANNDFRIRQGLLILSGKIARNDADVMFTAQPWFGNPSLTPPIGALITPAATGFIVYLDVWEREIDTNDDADLTRPNVGLETTLRIRREWAVRVQQGDLDSAPAAPPGHLYYPLARLRRHIGNDQITGSMIEDLRDTQVSIRRRIEIRNSTGILTLDNAAFLQTLEATRNNVLNFIRYLTTEFNPIDSSLTSVEILGLQCAQDIVHAAINGISLVHSKILANDGALRFLESLYEAENHFFEVWRDELLSLIAGPTPKYAPYQNFLIRLDERLHRTTGGGAPGLLPSIQANDLLAASTMQAEIARLFGAASQSIPRGALVVTHTGSPPGNLLPGQVVRYTFMVKSFTTLADSYTVHILPVAGWMRRVVDAAGAPLPGGRITVGANGTPDVPVFVDVTVEAGNTELQIRVTSDSNELEVTQASSLLTLEASQPSPQPEQVQIILESPTLDPATGNLLIEAAGSTVIGVRIRNLLDQEQSFNLTRELTNPVGTWGNIEWVDNTVIVGAHQDLPREVSIEPQSGTSIRLRLIATTTVGAATVTGALAIPVVVQT